MDPRLFVRTLPAFALVLYMGASARPSLRHRTRADAARTGPVAVRHPEGLLHGYLVLTVPGGDTLAWGELVQTVDDDVIDSRMVFRFTDGSVHDERARFTQDGTFRLARYTLEQYGPSFPTRLDATLDAATGSYRVESRGKDDDETQVKDGTVDVPPDTYSGMMPIVVKNFGERGATVHVVAFAPDAQLVEVSVSRDGSVNVHTGETTHPVAHWVLDPDLGLVKGALAALVGRSPSDQDLWIATGDAPAFLRFEGPLYVGGPTWRIERTVPRWP